MSNSAASARTSQRGDGGGVLGLDAAILKSIELCPNEELKRKMFSCVLLVGGGVRFRGIERYLAGRLTLQVPPQYRSDVMEVIVDPKESSSSVTVWRGAAILACLETAQELWIYPDEWRRHGQKLLRERAPFPWA